MPAPPPTRPAGRVWSRHAVLGAWSALTLTGTAAVVSPWTPVGLPEAVARAGAVVVSVAFVFALGVRTGGRPVIATVLASALVLSAVVTGEPWLLAASAVSTAVAGAVLGVMVTQPAARVPGVLRECLVALLVAVVAAFAAEAYGAHLSFERTRYLVLGLSLLGALALAYRLAAGLHGLGRRGVVMLVAGLGLLAVSLAYTEALSRWGSPGAVAAFEDLSLAIRDRIGAVPRPTQFLLGFPALAWGISTRARRRQGWWGTGFGAAGLAVVTVALLNTERSLLESGLTTTYSLVLGLLLGYLVIRADSFLSGARGRPARRREEAAAHRPEPGRTLPLL